MKTYTKESSKDKQYTVTEVKILQRFLEYHFCKIFYHTDKNKISYNMDFCQ